MKVSPKLTKISTLFQLQTKQKPSIFFNKRKETQIRWGKVTEAFFERDSTPQGKKMGSISWKLVRGNLEGNLGSAILLCERKRWNGKVVAGAAVHIPELALGISALEATLRPNADSASPPAEMICPLAATNWPLALSSWPLRAMAPPVMALTACSKTPSRDLLKPSRLKLFWV